MTTTLIEKTSLETTRFPALFHGIKNLIFDLGGVLYDIDYAFVEQEFARLQLPEFAAHAIQYTRQTQPEIFTEYEIGVISTEKFCEGLRREVGLQGTDEDIAQAWNSMLLGVFPGRVAIMARLKQRYNLSLLSNTNDLHLNHILPECREMFSYFDRLFLSYEMGLRKPQPEIFHTVLDTMGYTADETLFIDDSIQHIESAKALGIHTLWLHHPESLDLIVEHLLAEQSAHEEHVPEPIQP